MYEFVWFITGVVSYRILSRLLGLGQAVLFFREMELSILLLLAKIADDLAFLKEFKHRALEKSKLSQEEINDIKELDERTVDGWKEVTIEKLKLTVPRQFRSAIRFSTWREAMNLLSKNIKDDLK